MAKRKAGIRLTGRFPVGTTVELREVAAGALPGGPPMGAVVARTKTSKESVTAFEDVVDGKRYQAVAEVDGWLRVVNVTGKVPLDDPEHTDRPAPVESGVFSDPGGSDSFSKDRFKGDLPPLVAPGNMPRQDQARSVLQRSSTEFGEATPMDKDEVVPHLDQQSPEFSSGKVVQRSDTEFGQATPIPDVPLTQAQAREAGVWQASATPVGEATPLRDGGPVVDRLAQDSPEEKVGGAKVDPAPAPATAAADPLHRSRDELLVLAGRYEVEDADGLDDTQLAAVVLEREGAAGIDVEGRSAEDADDDEGPTKAVLLDRARELGVKGRSKMSKAELQAAIEKG